MAAFLSLALLALDVMIYIPFVKVSNKVDENMLSENQE